MSKKLTVLATAHALESFTVAELASKAGLTTSTVHTVLSRVPEGWFKRTQQQTGARGGQSIQYELLDEGRRAIQDALGAVSVLPSLAPEQPALDEPLGLSLAEVAIDKLVTASPEIVDDLVSDVSRNLQWAESELNDDTRFVQHHRMLQTRLQLLRLKLTYHQLVAQHGELAAGGAALPRTTYSLMSHGLHWPVPQPDAWTQSLNPLAPHLYDIGHALVGQEAKPALTSAHKVFIGYMQDDVESRILAAFAQGAVATAHRDAGQELDLVVEKLGDGQVIAEIHQRLKQKIAAFGEFVLCVNSEVNPEWVSTTLQELSESETLRCAVVLDHGKNDLVRQIANTSKFAYATNVADSSEVNWVSNTLAGLTCTFKQTESQQHSLFLGYSKSPSGRVVAGDEK